jgi:hypothetical protein
MKIMILRVLLASTLFVACSRVENVMTIEKALAAATKSSSQPVIVEGYYIHHPEGDGLYNNPGEQTGFEVVLRFDRMFRGQTGDELYRRRVELAKQYDQKYVLASGNLKRGPLQGAIGMVQDCIYLEVDSIRKADAKNGRK